MNKNGKNEPIEKETQPLAGEAGQEHPDTLLKQPDAPEKPPVQNKKKTILWIVIAAVCVVVFIICAAWLVERSAERRRQDELQQAAAAVTATPSPLPSPTPSPSPSSSPTPEVWPAEKEYKPNEREIDFDKLLAANPDVIGWIEVPGTDVDYPLVADEDNFYLTHDLYGEESVYGAIYMDENNKGDLQQPHLILYGHNMKDGSMFASLHKFEDEAFFDENRLVKIYTPKGQLDFEIFAAYARDDSYLPAVYGTEDKDGLTQYLDEIRDNTDENAHIRIDGVTADGILTLSTCVRGMDEQRYVVEAAFVQP